MTRGGGPHSSLAARYAALLRGTGAAPPLAASLLGRLALGVTGLALLLMTRKSTGSYASAGLVAAAYASSFAVFAPLRARRADRRGPRGVLLACSLTHPVLLLAVVLFARADARALVLALAAVAAGATVPPLSGVMRALWPQLVPADDLATAYSLESVVVELCFVGGPLLVAGLTAASGPSAAVLAGGLLVLGGGTWLAVTPALVAVVPVASSGSRAGPLSSPAVRAMLLTVLWVGAGFGVVEVAVPAYVEHHGASVSTAGVLLALLSAGSILGGLVYGAVRLRAPHARQLPWLVGALAVGCLLPLLAPRPLVLGLVLVV